MKKLVLGALDLWACLGPNGNNWVDRWRKLGDNVA